MRKNRNYWTKEIAFSTALNFVNKRDFNKSHVAAYELLRKNGWLDEACSHMKNINHAIKWTKEKCREEALKYKTKADFRNNCSWGYHVAKENNWLEEITSHTIKHKHVTPIKWTKYKCQEEALKYENRNEFHLNSSRAHSACVRNKWLNEVCAHMKDPYSCKFKWTKEMCQEIALEYSYRKEFSIKNKNAYYSARHNGWLDEICQHMIYKKVENGYWNNLENCRNEAIKYNTKTEFNKYSQEAYKFSRKNGWIDIICEHMTPVGNRYNKCIYSYEFSDNHVYVGLTYDIEIRSKSRKKDKNDPVIKHMTESGLIPVRKQITDYIPVDDAIKMEDFYLKKYVEEGWIALNRGKTGGIGSHSNVWNFNRLKKMLSKYSNINDVIKNDLELYEILEKSGWINSFFPNEV